MTMRSLILLILSSAIYLLPINAQQVAEYMKKENIQPSQDTIYWMRSANDTQAANKELAVKRRYKFNEIDTNYIEPQQYNFTFMLQNTNTYEVYRLAAQSKQNVVFAPETNIRIGPYFGWRWAFLGYTFDVKHIKLGESGQQRQEYDVSLYSSMLGIDIYYRRTGSDYKIRSLNMGHNINTEAVRGAEFDGVSSSITGFNLYYIFNHRRFSYPAAFSQSTIQRRSAGSVLMGIGYTRHTLEVDWDKFSALVRDKLGSEIANEALDSTLMFGRVKYTDLSLSGGYAYNWAFARNWLLAGSLSVALAYKKSSGDAARSNRAFFDFKFRNVNIDGIARVGLVWNNSKWYVGMSSIMHAYNYRRSNFSTNNFFGSINVYCGVNFGRRGGKKIKNKTVKHDQ